MSTKGKGIDIEDINIKAIIAYDRFSPCIHRFLQVSPFL